MDWWEVGSVQVKAKRSWESGWRGMVKNASLRSMTEKWVVLAGMEERRVQGLGTIGWMGIAAALMQWRSWTNRYVPLGFFTAKMGVL